MVIPAGRRTSLRPFYSPHKHTGILGANPVLKSAAPIYFIYKLKSLLRSVCFQLVFIYLIKRAVPIKAVL